jgi:hypothetical protein
VGTITKRTLALGTIAQESKEITRKNLLTCGSATEQEGITIKHNLQNFCQQSGQIPNWAKSGIIFSKAVDNHTQTQLKAIFPVPDINESFIHLGHPLILPAKNRSEGIQLCSS